MVTAVIVGAGHRSLIYAEYAKLHPEEMRITGLVEPEPNRRKAVQKKYGLPAESVFNSVEELCSLPSRIADAAINGTMDELHVPTSLPLLEKGYHLLLEKPAATTPEDLKRLAEAARRSSRIVLVCHVLRYAPFYAKAKKVILSGAIGTPISIATTEFVSYHHFATCFVRGKWGNSRQCGSGVLMAKCCHDLDLISWLAGHTPVLQVESFGSRHTFAPENAPKNAGNFCLLDCPLVDRCDFSAKRLYLDHPERWGTYLWPEFDHAPEQNTPEAREALLKDTRRSHSRCVWKCGGDQCDRQVVMAEFANGCLATHHLIGGTATGDRTLRIIGTDGELEGRLSENRLLLKTRDLRPGYEFSSQVIETADEQDSSHGGGDLKLVEDFCRQVTGRGSSISSSSLEDSLTGLQIVFAAERSRLEKRRIQFQ